jgi:uncharacterized membrane protein
VHTRVNVAQPERWASSLMGAALATYGMRRRSMQGALLVSAGSALLVRGVTGHCPVYQAAGIDTADYTADRPARVTVDRAVTINAMPARLFSFWRNFENLPRFMDALVSVQRIDDKRSHWVAKAPGGTTVEWDAEIVNEIPDELIAWRTLSGADVISNGAVRFRASAGRGTVVQVTMQYEPPLGTVGKAVAWMLGKEPSQTVREELRHFKNLMESGEIPTTDGQPRGRQSILNYD